MKDIDFDELDRAVSSVLGQSVADTKEETGTATTSTSPLAEGVAEKKTTVLTAPEVSEAPKPVLTQESKPNRSGLLAAKRRGRFMDVMHPSAEMVASSPSSKDKTSVTPSRTPVTLQPLTKVSENETKDADSVSTPTSTTPLVAPEVPAEPIAELDESHSLIGAEPAPIEVPGAAEDVSVAPDSTPAATQEESVAETEASAQKTTEASLDEEIDTLLEEEATADVASEEAHPVDETLIDAAPAPTVSPETPFLTDTKVDKRPLGGFGSTADTTTQPGDETIKPAEDTQSAPTVTLPRELQSDIVEVESSQDGGAASASRDTPLFATDVAAAPEDDGRVEGHPLFDTSTYHEPIAAANDGGMPGWLKWTLGLAVCLALGAGVGYFLFTAGF